VRLHEARAESQVSSVLQSTGATSIQVVPGG
jgi:hypothetical protein